MGQIDANQRVMRTGSLTGWPTALVETEVALGRLENWQAGRLLNDWLTTRVIDGHHFDAVVGTAVRASAAADTGLVID